MSFPEDFFNFLDRNPGIWLRAIPDAAQSVMDLYGSDDRRKELGCLGLANLAGRPSIKKRSRRFRVFSKP